MSLKLRVIDEPGNLRGFQPEWTVFMQALPTGTPFQLPIWLLTWWEHYGSGILQFLTFEDAGEIVGVIPLFLHTWNGRRQLTLIGSGISDNLDPGIKPGFEEAVREGIATYLAHCTGPTRWDVCDWQDLSANTPLRQVNGIVASEDIVCTEVQLTGTFEDFWQKRSKDMRRNLRRYSERARAQGEVTFEVSEDAAPELMDELIRLHAIRWEKQGESGMIVSNSSEPFLRAVVPKLAALGHLRTFVVRFHGTIAALVLTFLYRNRIYSYLSAFDPAHEVLGFGRTLLYEAIRHSFAEGVSAWNFLRGDEPYKLSWGAQPTSKARLSLDRSIFESIDRDIAAPSF